MGDRDTWPCISTIPHPKKMVETALQKRFLRAFCKNVVFMLMLSRFPI